MKPWNKLVLGLVTCAACSFNIPKAEAHVMECLLWPVGMWGDQYMFYGVKQFGEDCEETQPEYYVCDTDYSSSPIMACGNAACTGDVFLPADCSRLSAPK